MAKVICNLPNASELINGVKFVSHKDGMISEEIDKDEAEAFLDIPGYKLVTKEAAAKPASAEKPAADEKPADADDKK